MPLSAVCIVKLFGWILQRLYCLISASTKRSEIPKKELKPLSLKPLCGTHWEANRFEYLMCSHGQQKGSDVVSPSEKRKKRLTASLTSALRDSSSDPKIDESHLVRDQDCDIGAPNQELQYGFALLTPSVDSHCHPTTQRQI
ncbi:hypothetical protein TNCV_3224451 [Trichonephila clavipes]|nr:hypothetical protein TNCV_3224451 [Trichonephila clavipes]